MNERRASPRHFLVLGAEIFDEKSRTKANARTTDVSRTGCYLDTMNPFITGAVIRLKLTLDGETFESRGRVAYTAQGMGMGIAFLEPDPGQIAILERWLAEAPLLVS
jgi:hypothetical protein